MLLLSETAGFTLTLPGIAGLIIAVGITADSFIIFFERIRDEMREGKSMRVAVETGWKRARVTRLAAHGARCSRPLVLYIFATGAVKGFGFALGLSTLIDLASCSGSPSRWCPGWLAVQVLQRRRASCPGSAPRPSAWTTAARPAGGKA